MKRLFAPFAAAGLFIFPSALLFASAAQRPTSPAAPAAGEAVVELPPFFVRANEGRELPPWRHVVLPGFEVLSQLRDVETREFIASAIRAQELLRLIVPPAFLAASTTPETIVLVPPMTAADAMQDLLKTLPAETRVIRPGLFGSKVTFLANIRLEDVDAVATYAVFDPKTFEGDDLLVDARTVRSLLLRRTPTLPAWLVSGVVSLCGNTVRRGDTLTTGPLAWVSAREAAALRLDPVFPRTLFPLADFLVSPPPAEDNADHPRWQSQAALLVRWATDPAHARWREGFWKLVDRATREPLTEAAFRRDLGMTSSDLRDLLSDYLLSAIRNTVTLKLENPPRIAIPQLSNASAADLARIKGDFERMSLLHVQARTPEFADRYAVEVRATLLQGYEKGILDPRFLAVVGLYSVDIGDLAGARTYLEAAAKAGPLRPRAAFELAHLRYLESKSRPAGPNGRLNADQGGQVLEVLLPAMSQEPPLLEAFLLAANVWDQSDTLMRPEHVSVLDRGVNAFPDHLGLLYQVAVFKGARGLQADALALADRGVHLSRDPASKARFENLRRALGSP